VVGGVIGLLAGVGALAIPGIGPIMCWSRCKLAPAARRHARSFTTARLIWARWGEASPLGLRARTTCALASGTSPSPTKARTESPDGGTLAAQRKNGGGWRRPRSLPRCHDALLRQPARRGGAARTLVPGYFRPTTEQRYTSSVSTRVISGLGPAAAASTSSAEVNW
jgi:hypothetical protein